MKSRSNFRGEPWDHDIFPVLQKSLTIWFLFQVCVAITIIIFMPVADRIAYNEPMTSQSLVILSAYMGIPWFRKKLGRYYVIILIALLTLSPATGALFQYWFQPVLFDNTQLFQVFYKEIPFLVGAIVFTSWYFRFKGILIYVGLVTLLNIVTFWVFGQKIVFPLEFLQFLGLRIGLVIFIGYILSTMVGYAQKQSARLLQSNRQLLNYNETLEQLAANRERASMARELHDTLSHSLTALTIQLEVTKALIERDPEQAKTSVQSALTTAREGLKETRFALQHLRSSQVEKLGLLAGMSKLKADIKPGVSIELSLPDDGKIDLLSSNLQNTLYRIAQEAIHNTEKHGDARKISLTLAIDENEVRLEVKDDGRGFLMEENNGGGFGLKGMKERAMLAGGDLTVESEINKGTTITAVFDLDAVA